MPLNSEERMQYEEYKQEQQARPTQSQIEIALLEQQLHHCQNTNDYLNNCIDKLINQRGEINEAIRLYNTGERSEGITLDAIQGVLT